MKRNIQYFGLHFTKFWELQCAKEAKKKNLYAIVLWKRSRKILILFFPCGKMHLAAEQKTWIFVCMKDEMKSTRRIEVCKKRMQM